MEPFLVILQSNTKTTILSQLVGAYVSSATERMCNYKQDKPTEADITHG